MQFTFWVSDQKILNQKTMHQIGSNFGTQRLATPQEECSQHQHDRRCRGDFLALVLYYGDYSATTGCMSKIDGYSGGGRLYSIQTNSLKCHELWTCIQLWHYREPLDAFQGTISLKVTRFSTLTPVII